MPTVNPVFGQENENLPLDSCLVQAAKNNPKVKAAYTRYLAALEKVPQVGSLLDPEASFGFFLKPMSLMGGDQIADMRIMQMFPWFGTLKTARSEATAMAEAKFGQFSAEKADLYFRVKSKWYEMGKISRELALTRENIELLESLENIALIKFQSPVSESTGMKTSGNMNSSNSGMNTMQQNTSGMSGMSAPASSAVVQASRSSAEMSSGAAMGNKGGGLKDVLQVKMEILDQQNKLDLLNDRLLTAKTEFNALLNRDLQTSFIVGEQLEQVELPANKLAIADSILTNNPMLAMLSHESKAYDLMGEKAKKMGLPMMGAGIDYSLIRKRDGNTSMMNGNDMLMPMISVSIPIYRKKYDAMQKEARLMKESALLESESLKNDLQVQYRSFVQSLDDADRRMKLYREQEELARKTTDLLLSEFSVSGNGYEEVLRMHYRALDYGFKYIEALSDYNTNVALAEKLMNAVKQ